MSAPISWFHSFELRDGTKIAGQRPLDRLKAESALVFRYSVAGKAVLDIGAWDGYFSFEAEKRGAAEVHATDHFCWSGAGWGTKAGFDFVHNKTSSRVRSTDIDVFDLSPDRIGTFDVVLFLGVLYHLTNPYGGLELVYRLTKEVAVIETHVDMLNLRTPVMRFYRGAELNNDPTNFWAPNIACLEGMLKEVGFQRLDWSSADAPVVNKTMTGRQSGRVIVHAWK